MRAEVVCPGEDAGDVAFTREPDETGDIGGFVFELATEEGEASSEGGGEFFFENSYAFEAEGRHGVLGGRA